MNRGVAYSSQLAFQPLNVPASAMSLFPDKPQDFYEWILEHQHRYKGQLKGTVSATDFISRSIFGDYLKARLQDAESGAAKGVRLVRIYDEATAVRREGKAFQITFRSNEAITVEKAVLAPGNFPPGHLPIPTQAFYGNSRYVASPWAAKGLSDLPADAPVLLIGSSLTMVDLVGSLQAQGHRGKVYVVSRHGLLPQPFDVNTPPYPRLAIPQNAPLSALDLFRFVRNEIGQAVANGYTWRSVLDAMREDIPAIWQALPTQERERFLRHIRPYWETHRHRMPAASYDLLQRLQAQDKLEVLAATLIDMQDTGDAVLVTIKRRGEAIQEKLAVYRVINCTGPQCDFTKVEMPLMRQLLADGLLQPDAFRLGLLTSHNGTLLDERGTPITGLFTLGPPRKAMLYESTALREIRQQARELVQELLQGDNALLRAVQVA